MKWVLIYFILGGEGVATGTVPFWNEASCLAAREQILAQARPLTPIRAVCVIQE